MTQHTLVYAERFGSYQSYLIALEHYLNFW